MSTLVLPYTAVANQVAPSASYNANDAAIVAWANGNIDNTNIGSAGIFASQIKPLTAAEATFGATATGVGYKFLANDITAVPLTVSGVSGQSADIFDVTLTSGGTRELWVNSTGVVNMLQVAIGPGITNNSGQVTLTGTYGGPGVVINNATSSQNIVSFESAGSQKFFLDQNGTAYGGAFFAGYTTFGTGPVGSSATLDLGATRSTTSGLLALGGSSTAGYIDWGVSTTGQVTITKSGGGYPQLNAGVYNNASDAKFKTNVVPLDSALALIHDLKPVSFQWIDSGKSDMGFIAQDVQTVFPELVSASGDGDLGVNYDGLIPVLAKAIQELAVQFTAYAAAHP